MRLDRSIIPNGITAIRLAGSVCLFFVEPFSKLFFIVYTVCGISDVVDGTIARLLGCVTDFGAKLDSVSDMTFYAVMILRIFPMLLDDLPLAVWIFAVSIALLRISSYLVAAIKYHRFASIHSYGNKLTGAAVFLIPYLGSIFSLTNVCGAVCVIAFLATLEELTIHIISASYDPNMKSILMFLPKK